MNKRVKKVHIIGAGFSGLSLAYLLLKEGIQVELFDRKEHSGGLISSKKSPHGLVESAANGFVATSNIENLLNSIGVDVLKTKKESKKRYIYYNSEFKRWPLGVGATIRFILGLLKLLFFKSKYKPSHGELLSAWAKNIFGESFTYNLLAPGLYGIYATDIDKMSAILLTKNFFKKEK